MTPRSLGFELDKPLESFAFFLLLSFIATTTLAWGSVLPAGQLRIELFAFVIGALTLASRTALTPLRSAAAPIALLTALASLGIVQLIPISPLILETLSPESLSVYGQTNQILHHFGRAEIAERISIAPSATRSATLFALALVSLCGSSIVLLSSRRRRRMFLAVFLTSATVQILVATTTFGVRTTGRISGPFVNPNHFSAYLEIAFACSLGVLWREVLMNRERGVGGMDRGEELERRILPISLAALLTGALGVGIGLTKSRGGVAAAVLMTVIFVFLGFIHQRLRHRTRTLVLGLTMLTLAFIFIAVTAKREPILRYLESDPRELAADTRVELWSTSIDVWREFPIFGSGLGSFREAYRRVQPREIPQLVEQAHSDPIQLLVTGGLLGFLLGAGAFVTCLTMLVRAYNRQRHREELAFILAGIGALLVIGIHGLVEFNLSIPAIPATLVSVIGMAFAASVRGMSPGASGTSPVKTRSVGANDTRAEDLDFRSGFRPDSERVPPVDA